MTNQSPTFCILPWASVYVNNTGDVHPCCHSKVSFGNIKNTPIQDIWHGEQFDTLRRDMVNGEWNPACATCKMSEMRGQISRRQQANINPVHRTVSYDDIRPNPIQHVSIDLSNLCNLKCRMCGPSYSTKWFSDHKKIHGTNGAEVHHFTLQDLEPLMPGFETAEFVEFEGGEPFMIDTFKEVLELFVTRGWTDKTIGFFSNVTVVDTDTLSLLCRFKRVCLTTSIDAVGPAYSYMRGGTYTIQDLEPNIDQIIMALGPILELGTNITYQVFNAFNMSEMVPWWMEFCEKRGLTYWHPFGEPAPAKSYFARLKPLVRWPPMYSVANMPPELKAAARLDLENLFPLVPDGLLQEVEETHRYLEQPANDAAWEQFLQMTPRLDEIRGEDIRRAVPRLSGYFPR